MLVGDGPMKQRLTQAYDEHLESMEAAELPSALRESFDVLRKALTRTVPVGSESRVQANVRKMSSGEAASHAATILKLYAELVGQGERAEPLKVVTTAKKPPRFLTHRP